MQKKSRGNCQPLFHALLYFGVLAGLLFSSGEGIRLFPFPSPASAQNEKSFLSDGKKSDYKENVFRFEKGEGSFSKFPRNAKDFWASFQTPQKSPVFKLAFIFQADSAFVRSVFKSRFISQSPGSRAPPFS
jgi:hypothetical protein